MSQTITPEFKAALGVSSKWVTEITCELIDGTTLEIGPSARLANGDRGPGWTACTVSPSNNTGVRYSASLVVTPAPGADVYGIVSAPGAQFTIRQGIDFGAGNTELVDFGVYEAASGGVNILGGDIQLRLVDQWARLERSRFVAPYAPGAGTRADLIAAAVTAAIPGVTIIKLATGGNYAGGGVWDKSRTQFITDMAKDGSLDCYFNASGHFVIRTEPIIDTKNVVYTFRTGASSNIETADRDRPFDRLYNQVIVSPQADTQTWARQTVTLDDPTNPRWPGTPPNYTDGIGLVPFFYSSPTLSTAAAAKAAGATVLQRVQGTTETLRLGVMGNPALEPGDTITVAHDATDTDPGFAAIHLLESFDFDCQSGRMTAATRSSSLAEVEES